MKKVLFLTCLVSSLMFAQNLQNYELINLITNDLRGVSVDDTDCQNTIIEFHKTDSNLVNEELALKYQACMQKKNEVEVLFINTEQDEKECKKAIFEFYGVMVNNGKTVELDKEFQHCMDKKAVAHAKEAEKGLKHANDSSNSKFAIINETNLIGQ